MEEKLKEAVTEKEAALKAAKESELKAAISTYVKTCRSFGQDDKDTKAGVIREYSLSDEEAEQYMS